MPGAVPGAPAEQPRRGLSRQALWVLLLSGAGTLLALLVIRLIALYGYESLTPIFYRLLIVQDDVAGIAMLVTLLAGALLASRVDCTCVVHWLGIRPRLVALLVTLALCAGALLVYRSTRLSMDEYAAYFQSQAFASGRLTGSFPAGLNEWLVPIGFLNMSATSGAVASDYLPGFALVLAPFTLLGVPWACNALLTGLTVLVIHRLAMRLYRRPAAAGLAVLLTVASPVVLANGISYYSMTACMLANATFALLLLGEPTGRRLLLAGLVGSLALTLHSPARHVPFALPWLIWVALRPHPVRSLALLGAGYLPLTLVLGLGWLRLSSLLAGPATPEAEQASVATFTLPTLDLMVARLGGMAKLWVWAVPGLIVMAVLGFWRYRRDARLIVLAASFVCLIGGYLVVSFDQGHGWGYRYIHSAWFVLPLLAAALAAPPSGDLEDELSAAPAATAGSALNLVAALAVTSLVAATALRGWQIHGFIDRHLAQRPQYAGAAHRLVFIDTRECFYCVDLIQNDPDLGGDAIHLHSHGSRRNAAIAREYWPGHRLVHVDRYGEVYAAAPAGVASQQE